MKLFSTFPALLLLAVPLLAAAQTTPVPDTNTQDAASQETTGQDAPPAAQSRYDLRYSISLIDDATIFSGLIPPLPTGVPISLVNPPYTLLQNQLLLEPSFTLRYKTRWHIASSVVGVSESFHGLSTADFNLPPGSNATSSVLDAELTPYTGTYTQLRVKEAYAGLSAGDFDFTLGRRVVRWGTGYAFTAAGVLDPPRIATNPTDRLNINEGRDMIKADYVRGPHAFTLAWSTAALVPAAANLHDTTAFRYNVLVHGFDTSLIAGDDRGGDAFGGLTFTRVLGQSWEVHGEAAWREHEAILIGAKHTTARGVTFIAEYFTPPNTPYYRDTAISPLASRQNYLFLDAGKNRLRERPGWKEWDLSAYMVANLNDHSFTAIFDANRRFGNHVSTYLHLEIPAGKPTSDYGSTPYSAATSMGVRFQL
jgi:hypothetical protein